MAWKEENRINTIAKALLDMDGMGAVGGCSTAKDESFVSQPLSRASLHYHSQVLLEKL